MSNSPKMSVMLAPLPVWITAHCHECFGETGVECDHKGLRRWLSAKLSMHIPTACFFDTEYADLTLRVYVSVGMIHLSLQGSNSPSPVANTFHLNTYDVDGLIEAIGTAKSLLLGERMKAQTPTTTEGR